MAGLQLSGLASNLDWKTLVDQLIAAESTPITRIRTEQQTNSDRSTAMATLGTKMSTLSTAAAALKDSSTFSTRVVSSSATSGAWSASADAGGALGSFSINVTQLASAAKRVGASDVSLGLSTSTDVSGVTLATLRGSVAVSAGTLTVNGAKVTVSTSDSLQDVLTAIQSATGGDVVGSYDPLTDKITLASASSTPIVLGAANDTSNLFRVLKLGGNGTASVQSAMSIASVSTTAALASAGLTAAISNVDASGNGSFQINGETISYNVNTDTVLAVISRINASSAGVTASYDGSTDRFVLTNNRAGNLGISVQESGAGLMAAFGLTSGSSLQSGSDALFSVNGGPVLSAAGNTLDVADHGIQGLRVTLSSTGTQTLTVANDATVMRQKIDALVSAYNDVQSYIDAKSLVTTKNGVVTAGVLSANREVQEWSRDLRQNIFQSISGLSGSVSKVDDLGLGFSGIDTSLKVLDSTKLTNVLAQRPSEVADFFQKASTGLAVKLTDLATRFSGLTDSRRTQLTQKNTDLDRQIADLQRRLDLEKAILTNSFVAMESAQSKIQQQSQAMTRAFK